MNFISRSFETLQIIIKPLFMTLVLANHFYFISFICLTIYTGILVDYIASPQCLLYILGQKRNAAYKTYIVYGVSFTNLSQTICHSLRADSWIMSSWGCPSYHCHRTKLIHQFKPTFLSILASRHKAMTSWMRTVRHCSNLSETFPKTFNHPCMASKLLGYHRWRHVSL